MKVFLSWSGEVSHKVAIVFRDWLPSVIQAIEPYVSSEDIDKGARWSTDIAEELENSTFGILCVTKENIQSKLLLQIHDELIFDVKNEELEKVENIVKDAMENIVSLSVPLKVSTDVGTNWYDLK